MQKGYQKEGLGKRHFPLKIFFPYLVQSCLYLLVLAGAIYFTVLDTAPFHIVVTVLIAAYTLFYILYHGNAIANTFYSPVLDGIVISQAGDAYTIRWDEISHANYDSNAVSITLVLHDGTEFTLNQYDDLSVLIAELDIRYIRLEYKRARA